MNLEKHIEHTQLRPNNTLAQLKVCCSDAITYKLATLCVPPLFVIKAKEFTVRSSVKIATVAGYPLGYNAIEAKVAEIVLAIIDGADEVEMVVNTLAVINNDWQYLAKEINTVLPIVRGKSRKITVALETALMTDEEIVKACDIYGAAAVDNIKVGTGFEVDEHAAERIQLIRKHLADAVQIKWGGDVINFKFACSLMSAGANRLSCNNGLRLIQEALQQN